MALNFPDNPSLNDTYSDNMSGFTYIWNGTVWISVVDRKIGNIKSVDDISASFDGTETVFDFISNGNVISPLETNKTIVSVGGVLQNPGDDYSVFGEYITFATPPNSGLTFFGQVLQTDQSKSLLPDGSVGPEALSTGGFSWNSSGDFVVSGILTSGTSSVTLDGDTNQITVGTAGTINQSGIHIVGIMTAGSFVGDGSNLTGFVAGIGTTGSINTSGIITATSFTGDGRNLTDVGGYLAGLIYNPGIGNTEVSTSTGIAITFTKSIAKNTGVINLRENSIGGTIAESFDIATVGSSSTIAISGATLAITPDTTLGAGTTYFVEVPENTVRDSYNTGGNLGITSFTFQTMSAASLWGWGRNHVYGVLGLNDVVSRSSPTQLPGTKWSSVSGGNSTMLFLNTEGELYGAGPAPKLGLNSSDYNLNYSSPVQIPGTQWDDISSGSYCQMATKTDGTLWVWHGNQSGALGQNDDVARSSPTQIQGTQWDTIRAGSVYISYATKTDGTLWGWGEGYNGQLGLNDIVDRSSPTQLPGTQWDKCFSGYKMGYATKTDGTLWSWGYNVYGNLGQNDQVQYSSPVQIQGTQWSTVSNTWWSRATLGIKTDGTLWVWGGKSQGMLGLNDAVDRSSPTQLPGTQWDSVTSDYHVSIASKTDGTLWVWGYNDGGQGANNGDANFPLSAYRSSPVQIPGTQWSRTGIKNIMSSAFAFKTP